MEGIHPPMRRNPPTIQKQFDKNVERILDRRVKGQNKKNRRVEYLVQWLRHMGKRYEPVAI